nr:AAA family ATPase [Rhodobacter sp. CZR27]
MLRDGVDLVALPSAHRADEIAAALHAEMPWMAPAVDRIWQDLQQSVERGELGTRIRPKLLDGAPGIGKSYLGRLLAGLIGVPGPIFEATVENASFGLVGSQRGWGNAAPGRMINLILAELVGNPVIIVDEVEKAGNADSIKGHCFFLTNALLPLLEPDSAERWSCPYFEIAFDMRWVSWILASNDWRALPAHLISRCPPIRLERPTVPHLQQFARHQGTRRGLSETSIGAICEALGRAAARGYLPDLRAVIRMLDRAERMERRPPVSTQRNLHRLSRQGECLGGGFHVQLLMRAAMVVESDPVADGACRVLEAVEALAVNALLLQGPDHALDHAVLLRAMRGDELLLQAVAADEGRVFATGEE